MNARSVALSSAALFLLLTAACELPAGGRNPNYKEPLIVASLNKVQYEDNTVEYDRDVQVYDPDGLRMVPVVSLNGEELEAYSYDPTLYAYGDGNYVPVYQRYDLDVVHYWGTAFARCVMPGDFRITGPAETYIFDRESTLVMTWTRSAGAQWYWLSLRLDYDFNDTTGEWDNAEYGLDVPVYGDTFAILPWYAVFGPGVAQVLEGDGSLTIWAGNGPAVEPGDYGNIHGPGFGFFNAANEPMDRYFYVGAPPAARRVPTMRQTTDEFRARLRRPGMLRG